MKTALLTAPGRIELIDRELPEPGRDEVQVRITQCGVCTSELADWEGRSSDPLPVEIGHEIAGVVEAIGPEVSGSKPGDNVVVWVSGGGGFAERILVPERFCVAVPAGLAYPAVAEPLSCIVNTVELTAPALGDAVLIVGAGYMGNLLQMVTALKGPRSVIVADVREDALDRARALGATRTVNPAVESLAQAVAQETKDDGVDVAYEVTGVSAGLELVGEATRMNGKIAIVGYHQGDPRPIPLGRWNWMAFEILNAHFRRIETIMAGMRAGMSLVGSGLIDPAPLVTDVFELDEVADAFRRASMRTQGFVKAIVAME